MDHERDEVYERIPWETLEKKSSDRHWLVYLGAGAVTLGALAYSFVRNQPVSQPNDPVLVATSITAADSPVTMPTTASSVDSPVVYSEADLFAIDPNVVMSRAGNYAEWFAVEYFTYDGTDSPVLAEMLGDGVPMPSAPQGIQVFVDWVGVNTVTQTGQLSFEVEVVVRSLLSADGSGFVRQPVRLAIVPVVMDVDGSFRLAGLPLVTDAPPQSGGSFDPTIEITTVVGPDGVIRPAYP